MRSLYCRLPKLNKPQHRLPGSRLANYRTAGRTNSCELLRSVLHFFASALDATASSSGGVAGRFFSGSSSFAAFLTHFCASSVDTCTSTVGRGIDTLTSCIHIGFSLVSSNFHLVASAFSSSIDRSSGFFRFLGNLGACVVDGSAGFLCRAHIVVLVATGQHRDAQHQGGNGNRGFHGVLLKIKCCHSAYTSCQFFDSRPDRNRARQKH